ncbi:MAG: branched-chain amino acid ABC transporter permease [Candidatus Korarchaeum sp.]|nr:branched-chain amino acid ABC transporter permease [Candidatus Korarchaeum sp.]MDW8035678.1 branched-chain amino acid ABC transporter permease [Candidatus Korarchaeum sp.]
MLGITGDLALRSAKYYFLAFILLLPLPLAGDYITHLAIMIMLYSITAASLDILVGYTGRLSLGHAAFYAIGAYTSTLLSMNFDINPWIGILVGGVLASLFGLVLGIPSLKLKGPYLAISTLGFGVIVQLMLINLDWLTRGPIGIPGIPPLPGGPLDLRSKLHFYYIALVLTLVTVYILHIISRSRIGKILMSIREDEDAALSVGVNVPLFKVLAFLISTFFAGFSGGLYAHYVRYISPAMSALSESINILSMTIIGGFGTLIGPLMGAAVLTVLQEVLRPYLEYRYLIYGALIVIVMKFLPSGIYGFFQFLVRRVRG